MRPLTPYEHAVEQIETPEPLPDEAPVAPPQAPIIGTFSYVRGQGPPGTLQPGYAPFAGGGHRAPAQPLAPPAPPV